ncbi:MAG: 30S ribosome-binding factor RbfA [Patescibacteria group bacterium]|nr:30S ribosome-binding factor RbfA [Patescibacteria group bacterium]
MASENRVNKVNELIRRLLAEIILRELEFPRGILTTISEVKTSSDLSECKVFVSVFPTSETKNAFNILQANIYFLQQLLNKKTDLRITPKIVFKTETASAAAKVEKILDEIKTE